MPTLSFEQARACVLEQVAPHRAAAPAEVVPLERAAGRVLDEDVAADRDYPPFHRSARDGYAVRAADLPGTLLIAAEIPAGTHPDRELQPGEAAEIMTGAPLPRGADAVVMVEHVRVDGDRMTADRYVEPGENFTPQGAESLAGDVVLPSGARIGWAEVGLLATVGRESVRVCAVPNVAILATGDELVGITETPETWQIRNSNAWSLAAQVRAAGGEPHILPIARDNPESTLPLIEQGLRSDLLLMSGGVSAGKYDIIERMLAGMGAEFFFDRVLIQPGQPLVFGRARGTFFFGLPGNPASTMVTFEVFASIALKLLAGESRPMLPLTSAMLTAPFRQRPGLTRILPAMLADARPEVAPVGWAGSADIGALCRANAFLVSDPERTEYEAGEPIRVLLKR